MNQFTPNTEGRFENVPMEVYRSAPGVNKSLLTEFMISPRHAFEIQNGLREKKETDAMEFGTLSDTAIFDPENFDSKYYVRPETYTAIEKGVTVEKDWTLKSNSCKDWVKLHSDRAVISQSQLERILAIRDAIFDEPQASDLLQGCVYQSSIFAIHERTGLLRKTRPDAIREGSITDLKTIHNASLENCQRALWDMGYMLQGASYLDVANSLGIRVDEFHFIFVESGEIPRINVRTLDEDALTRGRWLYDKLICDYAECLKTNEWRGYCEPGRTPGKIGLPKWADSKLMDMIPKLLDMEN